MLPGIDEVFMLKSTRRQSRVGEIAIAAVDLLWMTDAIEPGLDSETSVRSHC
jgi:hypothetical protein